LKCLEADQTFSGILDLTIIYLMAKSAVREVEICLANTGDIERLGRKTVLYLRKSGSDERTSDFIVLNS